MRALKFFLPTTPTGKGRPKFSVRGGHVHAYTPEKTANAEAEIRVWMRLNFPQHIPFDGPCRIEIIAAVARSKAAATRLTPIGTPDLDNIVKLLSDALNTIAWIDDSQVVELTCKKVFAKTPWDVGYSVSITELCSREQNNGINKSSERKPRKLSVVHEFR